MSTTHWHRLHRNGTVTNVTRRGEEGYQIRVRRLRNPVTVTADVFYPSLDDAKAEADSQSRCIDCECADWAEGPAPLTVPVPTPDPSAT